MSTKKDPFILALPKGRVFKDFLPKLENTPFALKDNFENSRKMLLDTRHPDLKVLIIRGWDVPAYITSGAAHLGVVGKDILIEKGILDADCNMISKKKAAYGGLMRKKYSLGDEVKRLFDKIRLSPKKFIPREQLSSNKYRAISDFISGMTDRYAINLNKNLK